MRNYFKSGKPIFWLGLIAIVYMFAILANETSKNYQLRSRADQLENQVNNLEKQIQELGFKITYYKTDEYRERLAREKLNVSAAGESVVIITDDSKNNDSSTQGDLALKSDEQAIKEKPNYQQWWYFLFGE